MNRSELLSILGDFGAWASLEVRHLWRCGLEEQMEIFTKNFTNIMIGVVPLLGLLGTVVGMIDTFNALQSTGADVQSLSAGISKAMITTSSGLCVAIFGTCILPLKPQE